MHLRSKSLAIKPFRPFATPLAAPLVALLVALLVVSSAAFAQQGPPDVGLRTESLQIGTIGEYLADNANLADRSPDVRCYTEARDKRKEFTCLYQALEESGMLATLNEGGPFTLFAPTDHAFEMLADSLGPGEWQALFRDPAALAPILSFHLLPRELSLQNLYLEAENGTLSETTVQGADLQLRFDESDTPHRAVVTLGDGRTSDAGVPHASGPTVRLDNGTLIPISRVLSVPTN